MPLIDWKPFKDLEEFFKDFSHQSPHGFDLAADVYEENNTIIVKMNIPGIDPDKIEISVENNHLHISGERKEEKEVNNKTYHKKEIRCGFFERIIPLPSPVSEEQTTAECSDGILKITLPKSTKEKKVHKVTVTKK